MSEEAFPPAREISMVFHQKEMLLLRPDLYHCAAVAVVLAGHVVEQIEICEELLGQCACRKSQYLAQNSHSDSRNGKACSTCI